MNDTLKTQLAHRSIRQFQTRPVQDEVRQRLLEVVNRTATSTAMQRMSIVRLVDPAQKAAFAKICNQDYIAQAPELWMFIVDCYRNAQIAKEKGVKDELKFGNMDFFFQGFTDAILAAQNLNVALESLGLGGVFLGSPLNDAQAVVDLLDLPPLTFPALGIAFGYPNEEPMLKPRLDMGLKFFEGRYQRLEGYSAAVADYDAEISTYIDLRNPTQTMPPFSAQVVRYIENPMPSRKAILKVIRAQGFDFSDLDQ